MPQRLRGPFPGSRVVLCATVVVAGVARLEAQRLDQIGIWTGATLIAVSVISVFATRPGDRPLPAMMPPLVFLVAALVGGQLLTDPDIEPGWERQAQMVLEVLGGNAPFVVIATFLTVTISLVLHLRDRRRARGANGAAPAWESAVREPHGSDSPG